jgi:hypothetical protein
MSSSDDGAGAGQPSEPKRTSGLECHGGGRLFIPLQLQLPLSPVHSLRSVNVRSKFRFNAFMTPMRANIAGPSFSATSNSACMAACHSSASCSALGSSVMYLVG